jgi:hypothetical protein
MFIGAVVKTVNAGLSIEIEEMARGNDPLFLI